MGIRKIKACVVSQKRISSGVYSMWLSAGDIGGNARAGQFLAVYSRDASRLLPRPLSICETDRQKGLIRIVYRIAGAGTEEFSRCVPGDVLEIMGPLGNGYPVDELTGDAVLAGGGIGIPPLLELAREMSGDKTIVLGYRDEIFLSDEFENYGNVIIATEDGSRGVKGNVIDAILERGVTGSVICACGPVPMLKAVKEYAVKSQITAWVSLEERMACGIGACLSCVCRTAEADPHTNVCNRRVCKDGPVFDAREIEF